MMIFLTVLLVLVGFAASMAFLAWTLRLRHGTFEESTQPGGQTVIETDLARMTFDPVGRALLISTDKGRVRIPVDDITDWEISRGTEQAGLQEFLFHDFGVTDLLYSRYRDQIHTWVIRLESRVELPIPVWVGSQHKVRDFWQIFHDLQVWMMEKVGLHEDVRVCGFARLRRLRQLTGRIEDREFQRNALAEAEGDPRSSGS